MQKHGPNLSFVLFCLFMLPIAHARDDVPIHPVDGEYIKEWLVLGPFFPDDLEKDFLIDVGGEANIQPKEGDTVLFMSDGFEEMFNPQDEMLGDQQVKVLFEETAANSPEEIIEHLKNAGEAWANGRDQEDDVTFVVIKIKK